MKKFSICIFSLSLLMSLFLIGCGQQETQGSTKQAQKEVEKPAKQVKQVDFPKKPIEMVLPFAAGGSADLMARALADSLKEFLPESVVVVNKDGAGGTIGTMEVAKGKADGYTLLINANGPFATQPHMRDVGYTVDDFQGIIGISYEPIILATNADSPWDTIDDLLKEKDTGKVIKYGHSAAGGLPHLAQASFYMKAGIKAESVPFKGGGPAVAALLGGHVDTIAAHPAELLPHVKTGKFKLLGVASPERLKDIDIPTFKEKGFDIDMSVWKYVLAPKDTPKEVLDLLRDAFQKAADSPKFQELLKANNLIYQKLSGDEVIAKLKREENLHAEVIQALGIGKK